MGFAHICAYCGKEGDLYGGWWNGREIYFCGGYHMREFHREKEAMENSAAADSLIDGVVGAVVDTVCSFSKVTGFLGNSVKKGIKGIKNYLTEDDNDYNPAPAAPRWNHTVAEYDGQYYYFGDDSNITAGKSTCSLSGNQLTVTIDSLTNYSPWNTATINIEIYVSDAPFKDVNTYKGYNLDEIVYLQMKGNETVNNLSKVITIPPEFPAGEYYISAGIYELVADGTSKFLNAFNFQNKITVSSDNKLSSKKSTSEHTLSMRGDDIVYTGSPSVFEIDSCLIISLDSSKTIKIHDIDIENKSDWNTADYCVKVWLSRKKTYANVKVDDLCLKTIEFNSMGPLKKLKIDIKEEISVPDTLPGGSYYVWLSLHEHDEAGKDVVSKEYRREIYYNVPLSEAEKEAERIAKEEAIAKEIAAEKAEWEKKQKEKAEAEKQAIIEEAKNSPVVDTPLSPEETEQVNEIKKKIFDEYEVASAINVLYPMGAKRPKDNGPTIKELCRLLLLCSKNITTYMGMPVTASNRPVRNILKTYSIYFSDDKEGPITEIDLAILDKDLDSAAAILEKAKKDFPNENEFKAKEVELLCRQYAKNKDKNLLTKAEKILKSLPKTDDKFLNMYFAFVKDFYSAAIGDTHGLCTGKGYFYLREKDLFGLPADTGEKKISVPEPESKPEFIFCYKCGTKLPADAGFCFKCGTKLK